jgi:hypothetical protein
MKQASNEIRPVDRNRHVDLVGEHEPEVGFGTRIEALPIVPSSQGFSRRLTIVTSVADAFGRRDRDAKWEQWQYASFSPEPLTSKSRFNTEVRP